MNQFVVSAIKYRPQKFSDVVGQSHVSETLKNAIKNNRIGHAYLFCGSYGTGKTTNARIFAKILNCTDLDSDYEACRKCQSCISFDEGKSTNIFELDAASNNSVEHIKDLNQKTRIPPQNGKYKIFIIDEVHMLTVNAFNAFLKTIEEPPKHCIFILATTEKNKLIPTILSRCQIFEFKRIRVLDIVEHLVKICKLENIKYDIDALHIIAQKSNGALRDALSIFDRIVTISNTITYDMVVKNLNVLDYDYYFKITNALLCEDISTVLNVYNDVVNNGFSSQEVISGLAEHLRNLLVCKNKETLQLIEVSDIIKEKYLEQSTLAVTSFLLTALNICNDCDVNFKTAYNQKLHVEMTLIKITYINRALHINSQTVFNN